MKDLQIGSWVKVTKKATVKTKTVNIANEDSPIPVNVNYRYIDKEEFEIPQVGQISGMVVRYIGQYHKKI